MISFSTGKLRKKTWIRFLFKLLPQTEKNSRKGFEKKKWSKHLIGHLQRFFWSLIWIFTNIFWKSSWMEMEMLLQIGSDIIVALITLSLGDPSNFFYWLMFELINDGLHHCGFENQITVIENHKYLALSLISSRTFLIISDYASPTFPQIWSFFPWNYYFLLEMNGLRTNSTANKTAPF